MTAERSVVWIGSSLEDLRAFPEEVRYVMGCALHDAQLGGKHRSAEPWKGFKGATVLAISEDFDTDTYRTVYTVKFPEAITVLHAFKKKSSKARQTDQRDINRVEDRLRWAEELHEKGILLEYGEQA